MLDFRASVIAVSYIVAAVLFIFGLKRLSSPATARSAIALPRSEWRSRSP